MILKPQKVMEITGCFGNEPLNGSFFTQKDLNKYADVMIWALENTRQDNSKGKMESGDIVRLLYDFKAIDLVEPIYERCVKKGWNVIAKCANTENMEKIFFENANDDQLEFFPPWLAPPKEKTGFGNTIA